ncbi:MAG: nucleotidyltransferase family protein [Lysobacteraceae bacterium]|nr:MAG: nucleotidyltransferase family protein [Xanthomonadaceae bacterium]
MKALILAAGLGERMRPLTDTTAKPLLRVGGKPLIAWHLEKLAAIGVREVVINTSWHAEQFPQILGDGARWGLRLHYSFEGPTPLETGGGIWHALRLLGGKPFLAVNGDIWTDFDFARLPREPRGEAHLILIDNPAHNPNGDFTLMHTGGAVQSSPPSAEDIARLGDPGRRLTFAGIGIYRPSLFSDWRQIIGDAPGAHETPPRFKLAPLLRAAMAMHAVTGEHHRGKWTDVGTPKRLELLEAEIAETEQVKART